MNSIQQIESKEENKGSQSKSSNRNKEIQDITLKDIKKKSPSNSISVKENSNNKNNLNNKIEKIIAGNDSYYSESDDDSK